MIVHEEHHLTWTDLGAVFSMEACQVGHFKGDRALKVIPMGNFLLAKDHHLMAIYKGLFDYGLGVFFSGPRAAMRAKGGHEAAMASVFNFDRFSVLRGSDDCQRTGGAAQGYDTGQLNPWDNVGMKTSR